MIFWYGASVGSYYSHSPYAKRLLHTAAHNLSNSYRPEFGCVPVGKAMGGGDLGDRTLGIDSMAPLLQLFMSSGNTRAEHIANNHINTAIRECYTEEGAWIIQKRLDEGYLNSAVQPGRWARGHAWGLSLIHI